MASISDSIIMGAQHYEHEKPEPKPLSPTFPPMGIGTRTGLGLLGYGSGEVEG
jgi:hypothetical protein